VQNRDECQVIVNSSSKNCCEHSNEVSGSIKGGKFFDWLTVRLSRRTCFIQLMSSAFSFKKSGTLVRLKITVAEYN
jgi:hypothetical protein